MEPGLEVVTTSRQLFSCVWQGCTAWLVKKCSGRQASVHWPLALSIYAAKYSPLCAAVKEEFQIPWRMAPSTVRTGEGKCWGYLLAECHAMIFADLVSLVRHLMKRERANTRKPWATLLVSCGLSRDSRPHRLQTLQASTRESHGAASRPSSCSGCDAHVWRGGKCLHQSRCAPTIQLPARTQLSSHSGTFQWR